MPLTTAEINQLAKAGLTSEQMVVVSKMMARRVTHNATVTQDRNAPVTRDDALRKRQMAAKRAKKFREKHKLTVVDASVTPSVTPVLVSSALLPLLTETTLIPEVLNEKELVVPREAKKKQGHRLPDDFVPDARCETLARELNYTKTQWKAVLDGFFDYWRGVPGAKGCKLDWQGTFRNALRNAPHLRWSKSNGTHKPAQANNMADGFAQVRAVIAEAERREFEDSGANHEEDALCLPGLRQVTS